MATINIPVTFPDAAIPKIRAEFGGGTNAQTLAAVQAWLGPKAFEVLKERVVEGNVQRAIDAAQTTAKAAAAAVDTAKQNEIAALSSVGL